MSIASEIERIDDAKHAIKAAIEAKTETTIPEAARLEEYPALIEAIEGKAKLQAKSAVPSTEYQVIVPDDGYDGLSRVLVANAPLEEKTVTPTTSGVVATPTGENIGLSKVNVMGDINLTSSNIKNGTTIFGVTGNYDGDPSKITDIYNWCNSVGAVMPADKNLTNLLETVKSISEITSYTVKFNTAGGSAIEDQIVVYGHTINKNTETFKADHAFLGWQTADGEVYTTSTPIKKDVTLIAQWKSEIPTIMEDSNVTYLWGTSTGRYSRIVYKVDCQSLSFQMGGNPPETYGDRWDISYDNNGTVYAYIDVSSYGYGTKYNLTIYSAGNIALPPNCKGFFNGFNNSGITSFANIDRLRVENVTNMENIFSNCSNLTTLDLSAWKAYGISSLAGAFYGCNKLEELDLSGFDTSYTTTIKEIFKNCKALKTVDVSTWDTSNVTDMSSAFYECNELTSVSVGDWNTSKVTNMDSMFYNCSKVEEIDVSSWDVSKVQYMRSVFFNCSSITTLATDNWTISRVIYYGIQNFANGCSGLTSLKLAKSATAVSNLGNLASNCTNLRYLDISGMSFAISEYNDIGMVFGCTSLQTLDMRSFGTASGASKCANLGTFLRDVPTSCTVYVKNAEIKSLIQGYFPNHNIVIPETT